MRREQDANPIGTAWQIGQAVRLLAGILGVKVGVVLAVGAAVAALLGALATFMGIVVVQAGSYFGPQGLAVPPEHLEVMIAVEERYGIPWQVLAAIAREESSFGQNMGPSSAGAVGYCQFMPDTWTAYGRDENGDGVADPYDYRDCLPAVARFLLDHGWRNDDLEAQRQALYSYNHDWSYVDRILVVAATYGLGGEWQGGLKWPVPGYYGISSYFGQVDEARGPTPCLLYTSPSPRDS